MSFAIRYDKPILGLIICAVAHILWEVVQRIKGSHNTIKEHFLDFLFGFFSALVYYYIYTIY